MLKSSSLVWCLRRELSALPCHSFCVLTCLNPDIVLWNDRGDLASVGNVRSEGVIVRDSVASIRIRAPDQRGWDGHNIEQHSPLRLTNPAGMHEVLLVDEIARRIAEHLFDLNDKSSSLAFALCCRSLNDPVLDVLWGWQTDLVTLFKVLPPDLWELSNTMGLVSTDRRTSVCW